jgi:hypothetical protein
MGDGLGFISIVSLLIPANLSLIQNVYQDNFFDKMGREKVSLNSGRVDAIISLCCRLSPGEGHREDSADNEHEGSVQSVIAANQREPESLYGSQKPTNSTTNLTIVSRDTAIQTAVSAPPRANPLNIVSEMHIARDGDRLWNKSIDSAKTDSRKVTKRPRGAPSH